MASVIAWLNNNWFSALQGIGIIFGLLFTALSIRRDTDARRTSDLLTLETQHRDLWGQLYERPELCRVLSKTEVDLLGAPITSAEEEFLNMVFVHFYTGWLLAKGKKIGLIPVDALVADVKNFFNLPLPSAVWKNAKKSRDPKFVAFVDECLNGDR